MIIALFISINSVALAEKISIKGLDISYDEFNEQMTASGNAELHHQNLPYMPTPLSTIIKQIKFR